MWTEISPLLLSAEDGRLLIKTPRLSVSLLAGLHSVGTCVSPTISFMPTGMEFTRPIRACLRSFQKLNNYGNLLAFLWTYFFPGYRFFNFCCCVSCCCDCILGGLQKKNFGSLCIMVHLGRSKIVWVQHGFSRTFSMVPISNLSTLVGCCLEFPLYLCYLILILAQKDANRVCVLGSYLPVKVKYGFISTYPRDVIHFTFKEFLWKNGLKRNTWMNVCFRICLYLNYF